MCLVLENKWPALVPIVWRDVPVYQTSTCLSSFDNCIVMQVDGNQVQFRSHNYFFNLVRKGSVQTTYIMRPELYKNFLNLCYQVICEPDQVMCIDCISTLRPLGMQWSDVRCGFSGNGDHKWIQGSVTYSFWYIPEYTGNQMGIKKGEGAITFAQLLPATLLFHSANRLYLPRFVMTYLVM